MILLAKKEKAITIIIGPPCSGKGTQSKLLMEKKKVNHLSAGELLRKKYPKGTQERSLLDKGHLVNVELMNSIMEEEMKRLDFDKIFLDGYPRTLEQAKFISSMVAKYKIKIKAIIILYVEKNILEQRMAKRTICLKCEKTFKGPDNCCNMPTSKRQDDCLKSFGKRYKIYKDSIQNILCELQGPIFYVKAYDANEEEIFNNISEIIGIE